MNINKDKLLTSRARKLRKGSTLSEILLWKRLKNKQVNGKKFRRQVPIDRYIVDFYCHKLKLVIEVDGSSHYENEKYDMTRDKRLKEFGVYVLRIPDSQVKKNIQGVVCEIEEWISANEKPSPA